MKDPLAEYEDEKSAEAVAKRKSFDQLEFKKCTYLTTNFFHLFCMILVIWITAQMAKDHDRDLYLATNAKEMLFYIFFVICVTAAALGMTHPTMYFMAQGLRAQMVDHAGIPYPETEDTSKVKFYEITTVDDMWDYLEVHLLPLIYPDAFEQSKERDKGIGKENVLIGIPVIREVVVTKLSCPDPFPKLFKDCYPKYSEKTMHNKDLEDGWEYKTADETQGATWSGRVANYYGDGYQEELTRTLESGKGVLSKLKSGKFVQKGTRAIFIDVAYYNAHVNLFTAVKIAFELPPTGGVIPTANFYTLKLLRYVSMKHFLVLACEIIIMIMIIFYILEEIREFLYLKKRYFRSFWNYVDVAVITSVVIVIVTRIIQHFKTTDLLDKIEKSVDKYNSLQTVTNCEMCIRNCMAVAVFLVYFKLFKYLSFTRQMTELHKALNKSLGDVAAFLFMLAVIFTGFALFGCLSFSTQLWDFSSFPLALFALLRILLGDFTYDSLYEADPVIAPFFYLLFLITIFFILLNLFLAIVYDCYGDVKLETAILPEEKQMIDFWKTGIYNLMRRCGCKACAPKGLVRKSVRNKTTEDIRSALKRCGFNDLDIEMFLNRYNIDPDARVRTRDVEKLIDNLKSEVPPKPDDSSELTREPPHMPAYAVESSKPGMLKRREGMSSRAPTVATSDFASQQNRLDKIESVMASIAEKLDILLKKLNAYETRKIPWE